MEWVTPFTIPTQRDIDGDLFPLVLGPNPELSAPLGRAEALAWIHEERRTLRAQLLRHGALLFRGLPLRGASDFEAALDAAEFENMPYVGGAAPREQVTRGRILTANESPPDQPIPFHHEMAQVPNPPAYVFFYCDVAPTQGGATPIVHSHRVYERFRAIDPEFCAHIEAVGARYVRVMPDIDDSSSPIGRSWRSTFLTDDPIEAEARMRAIGTTWTWLDGGVLHTETSTVPAIRIEPRSGKPTFFNSRVAAYTGWIDARNDPKGAVKCGDGTPVNGETLLKTAEAMREEAVAFKWEEGDMLWLDNSLVLHSRQPFIGPRRILASIATA